MEDSKNFENTDNSEFLDNFENSDNLGTSDSFGNPDKNESSDILRSSESSKNESHSLNRNPIFVTKIQNYSDNVKMVLERDPGESRRIPREFQQQDSDGENPDKDDDDSEDSDKSEDSDESEDSDDEEIPLPPDLAQEAHMRFLRAQNVELNAIVQQQYEVFAEIARRTREIQAETARRIEELKQLKAFIEAEEAARRDDKPKERKHENDDKDPDIGGTSTQST